MASLLKRESGIYCMRTFYYDENGKRKEKRKSLETRDENVARRRMKRHEAETEGVKWKEGFSIPFHDAANRFVKEHCPTLKPQSARRYETNLVSLRPFFGTMPLASISSANLLAFEQKRRKDKVTTSTIRNDLACLSSIFSFAMANEWLEVNPVPAFRKARKKVLKPGNPRTRYLSHEEESRLLAACRAKSGGNQHQREMLYAAVVFALDTGCRLEEAFSLKWTEVKFSGTPKVEFLETKSGKPRKVPLLDRVSEVVSGLPVHPDSQYVFHNNDGARFLNMKRGFAAACKRARLKGIVWHDMRRTRGCRMIQDEGATLMEVKEWLGHSSVSVTEKHYAFLNEEALSKFVERDRERRAERPSAEIVPLRRVS